MQTRLHSVIEALLNVIAGYFVALLSQIIIFPMYGIHVSVETNIYIGLWFAIISFTRSYLFRRFFNYFSKHS